MGKYDALFQGDEDEDKAAFKLPTYAPPVNEAGPVTPESMAWAAKPEIQKVNAQLRLEGGTGTWEDRRLAGFPDPDPNEDAKGFAQFAAAGALGELAAPIIGRGISALADKARALKVARAGVEYVPPPVDVPVLPNETGRLSAKGTKGAAALEAAKLAEMDAEPAINQMIRDSRYRVGAGEEGSVLGTSKSPLVPYETQRIVAFNKRNGMPAPVRESDGVLRAEGSEGGAVEEAAKLGTPNFKPLPSKYDDLFTGQLDYEPAATPEDIAQHGLRIHSWQTFKDEPPMTKWMAEPNFNGVGLRSKSNPDNFVVIHRSTKEPGKWQGSEFDERGAVGDMQRTDPNDILREYGPRNYDPVVLKAEGSKGGAVEEGVRFKDSPLRHVITQPPEVLGKFDSRYPTHKWAPDEDLKSVELVRKNDPGLTTIVHGSTRKPGWWQASRFEDGRPVGDYQSPDTTEALRNFPPDEWEPTQWTRAGKLR